MANDTISQSHLFPICRDILQEQIRPLYYRDLTKLALNRLGVQEESISMFREIEDVREQFAKKDGVGYIPAPYCVFYLKSWVTPQATLFNKYEPLILASNVRDSLRACYEAIMRTPYMINKYNIPFEKRAMKRARGLLIEHHITGWFRQNWPDFVLEPDNAGLWEKPCSHDFKLKLLDRIVLVDVTGENFRHEFGGYTAGKNPTDIHICAGLTDTDDEIVIYGYIGGSQFTKGVSAIETQPIQRMIFYLNVLKLGLDYELFKEVSHVSSSY